MLAAPVGDLPYGTQRMVEVARAIVMNPRCCSSTSPAAGMDSTESEYFGTLLRRISREREMSVLIIEHDVAMVLAICDRVYVLELRQVAGPGRPGGDPGQRRGARRLPRKHGDLMALTEAASTDGVALRTPQAMLAARSLDVAYGSVLAVRGLSLQVGRGEIVALLGPNGAGQDLHAARA